MRPTSDQSLPAPAGGATTRRLGRATAIAAAALAGAAPAARAEPVAETSLTPAGTHVGDTSVRGPKPVVRVVDVAADGTRGSAVTVSDRSRPARLVGGTQVKAGAIAVAFDQQLGDGRWEPRLAFRPAGSSQFLPAVPTGPARRTALTDGADPVVLGPDGSGIVLGFGAAHGDSFVRRLAADGALGAPIVVAPRSLGVVGARAGVGPSGTALIVLAARRAVLDPYEDEPTVETSIYATTLAAGATRSTRLQRLATMVEPDDAPLPELRLAIDEDDYALVEVGFDLAGAPEAFAGPATELAPEA